MTRRWIFLYAALTACGSLAACGSPEATSTPSPAETPVVLESKREIAPDVFAVVIPATGNQATIERLGREACDGKDFCKVLGWPDADLLPRGFPMTDREVGGQVFSYSLNRTSGMDEAAWTCEADTTGSEACQPQA